MKQFIFRYPLLLILILAALIRFYQLGVVPPGPNWDEAALGYNAYSILKTGRDEYGTFFPLSLRSYDDYKPPLYMYLTVPSVALFGLNLWAVRLPSAVMGLLAILGTYYLTKELIQYSPTFQKIRWLPYGAAFLLALSPWHIQFSRIAFEANVGVTLTIWAATCFLFGLKRGWFLSLSALLFGLTLYAYHSQRISSPLLVFILGITFFPLLKKNIKSVLIACLIGIVIIAPLVPVLTNPVTLTRLRGTSALADQTRLLERSVIKLERDSSNHDILGKFFDNRRMVFFQTLVDGYLSHYSLGWLFVKGDNARHHAPAMALLYHIELPFLLIGLFSLAKYGKKMGFVILGWMAIAPIAASPTTELPHAIRSLVFLPTFQIAIAVGIWRMGEFLKNKKSLIRFGVLSIIGIVAIFNIAYYFTMYFVHQNREFSKFWQYGYQQAVSYAKDHYSEYQKIVVSTSLEQPHMFFLFFLQYDPKKYLSEGGTASGGFAEIRNRFDKYEFRPIHWERETHNGSILYIGKPSEIPAGAVRTIYYLNGEEAMRISQ